ncbi:MAG: MiaB/RimO family radical SAM methylthiotransferase [Desulfovibrio sp.]|nr:MiaB/RimO family radical SAM methylthiotransferase [Desulfovibrio sp.]
MSGWKFFLVTFGCKVNQYETQALREAWSALGGEECARSSEADVILINSCTITARGERDARNAVYRLRREAPDARLILTGCSAKLFADHAPTGKTVRAKPDLLIPQKEKYRLLQGPWPEKTGDLPPTRLSPGNFPPFSISRYRRSRPVLKVQEGCNHRCTYCIVPQTRGRSHSRPAGDILKEARRLLLAGYPELVISGINLGQYGRDTGDGDFWTLLATLDAALAPDFQGRARLRISSLEPGLLNQRGIDTLMACRMLCPHLHISLQHASQDILKRMGRGHYTPAQLETALEKLSAHWPVMGLGADLITGFPGETEEDLSLLAELVERLPMTYAHVFPYSRRPGTPAAGFDGQIPQPVKAERAARLRAIVAKKKILFLQAQATLPRMLMAVDRLNDAAYTLKGVNEYYATCRLRPAPGIAAQILAQQQGLLTVRPVSADAQGLVVETSHTP